MPHDGRCVTVGRAAQRTASPMPNDGRCASAGEPFGAVAHGGNPLSARCLTNALPPQCPLGQCPMPNV
ncbi:MAG: hypothetical protein KME31_22140 [Tolypothrix carrinoi HA7290-LM1]|nr:hypothetical protein [Tolypothrix carrinoi HA7290-LM1]